MHCGASCGLCLLNYNSTTTLHFWTCVHVYICVHMHMAALSAEPSPSLPPCRAAVCTPSALLTSCLSSSRTCCEQLTNCHGTMPNTPLTDVSAGWRLMKIDWKTSIGLFSWGFPWFIMPAFMPEATGSTLSASTDPSKFEGLAMQWAEGSLFRWLVCYWHISCSVEAILSFN